MARDDIFGTKSRYKEGVVMFKKDGVLYGKMHELTKNERGVLDYLIKVMADNLNTVIVASSTREELLASVGISSKTLSNVLSKLKKEGFIDKTVLANEYFVDPRLAVSGSEASVYANLARFEKELKGKKNA